jgi:hypothetical protein
VRTLQATSPQRAPDDDVDDAAFTAELTELALAADPSAPLPDDAVPLDLRPPSAGGLLPSWYMPPVMLRGSSRRLRFVIGAIILAFITIELFGLCSTYGPLVAA